MKIEPLTRSDALPFGFLFFAGIIMIFVTVISVQEFLAERSLEEIQAEQEYLASWPAVDGVTSEIVVDESSGYRSSTYYTPQVTYRYRSEKRDYTGSVTLGLYNSLEKAKLMLSSVGLIVPEEQEIVLEKGGLFSTWRRRIYKIDRPITVFVDPKHPEISTLDNLPRPATLSDRAWETVSRGFFILFLGGLGFIITSYGLFYCAATLGWEVQQAVDRFGAVLGAVWPLYFGACFILLAIGILWTNVWVAEFPTQFEVIVSWILSGFFGVIGVAGVLMGLMIAVGTCLPDPSRRERAR